MFTTDQKGAIAESGIAHAALKQGIGIYRPFGEGGRYDVVFDVRGRLLRLQCKWAPRCGDVVIVRCQSNRRAAEGLRRRCYTADEIDAIAAYCPELEQCYYLPIRLVEGRRQVQLRLSPSKNNQRLGVNWAKIYEFGSINWDALEDLGAIAQLGERRSGTPKVAGSSPASSTA